MPKIAKELTAKQVQNLKHDGRKTNVLAAVGGVSGLHLQITPTGARSWILRAKVGRGRRDIGLGPLSLLSLKEARDKAREVRKQIAEGRDPVAERREARAEAIKVQRRAMTFKEAMEIYLATKIEPGPVTVNKKQWRSTLEAYALPILGPMRVEAIEIRDVLQVLEPIWINKTETASRLRQRIEAVLSWATVAGHRTGDNPARWKGNLAEMLPKAADVKEQEHLPAISQLDAPHWWAHLNKMAGQGARALRFVALTASRTGEVRSLVWKEVLFENGTPVRLSIPAARMKAKRDHVVPLSSPAVEILREAAGLRPGEDWPKNLSPDDLVFPAPRGGTLSDMSLSAAMRRMHESEEKAGRAGYLDPQSGRPAVPHGLRSTFRGWAGKAGYPRELAEEAIAHAVGSDVERAYAREHLADRRTPMMDAWAAFLLGEAVDGNVVNLRSAGN